MLITSMSRLSYTRVLIEVDLLAELPNSINIVLPNGVSLLQLVIYESFPKFYKHCRLLQHTISVCTKVGGDKKGKNFQTTSIPTRVSQSPVRSSLGPSAETAAMEHQQCCFFRVILETSLTSEKRRNQRE